MTHVSDDKTLVISYVAHGSDAAFRALVTGHVDLVYGTALRQMRDPGMAEEITQNVFVALARKAPTLAGRETLAGWLYRTTLLESKARIRSELRRRRREETAAELATIEHEGVSTLDEMAPLLDEGLLNLRDQDRLALVLRFLENRSLRDVGRVLGVDEDAARKRVSRALERLTGFFRQQGFTVPAVATSATLLSGAAKAAPVGVATSATNAGLAAGGTGGSLNLLIAHFMALTKTQTAAVCLVLAVIPLVWQHHAQARINDALAQTTKELAAGRQSAEILEREIERSQAALGQVQNQSQDTEDRLQQITAQIRDSAQRSAYRWDDGATLVRLPKAFLQQLPLEAVANHRGRLREQIKEVLQMNGTEAQVVQGALDRFVAGFNAVQATTLRQVQPTAKELEGHVPEETRVFEIQALGEQLGPLRQDLFRDLESTLGEQRFELFRKALKDWMPLDDEYAGMNSGMGVFNFDHRVVFYKPTPGRQWLDWQIRKPNGEMMGFTVAADDVPPALHAQVQDWITLAQTEAASNENLPK